MKISIDEAIKVLSDSAYGGSTTHDEKFKASAGLGAEALKGVRAFRRGDQFHFDDPLPGELEEA